MSCHTLYVVPGSVYDQPDRLTALIQQCNLTECCDLTGTFGRYQKKRSAIHLFTSDTQTEGSLTDSELDSVDSVPARLRARDDSDLCQHTNSVSTRRVRQRRISSEHEHITTGTTNQSIDDINKLIFFSLNQCVLIEILSQTYIWPFCND